MVAATLESVIQAINAAGQRLGRALDICDEQPEGPLASCHEVNAVLNLMFFLRRAYPKVYAEGTLAKRGRVDLVAVGGETAIALRATRYAGGFAKTVCEQLDALRTFEPTEAEVGYDASARRIWRSARARWAIVLLLDAHAHNSPDLEVGSLDHEVVSGAVQLRRGSTSKPEGWMLWAAAPIGRLSQ